MAATKKRKAQMPQVIESLDQLVWMQVRKQVGAKVFNAYMEHQRQHLAHHESVDESVMEVLDSYLKTRLEDVEDWREEDGD